MKRIGAFMLALALCFFSTSAFSSHAAAADKMLNENTFAAERAICDALSQYAGGGTAVDQIFAQSDTLSMGSPIYAYEYTVDESFRRLDFTLYPIFEGEEIVAVATVYEIEAGKLVAQISTDFLYGIRGGETVTILYDATACYRYDSNGLTKVVDYSEPVETRGILLQLTGMGAQALECVEVRAVLPLQKSPMRSDLIYSCNVSFVGQGSYDKLCWAASVACIGNYLSTTYSYTAESLAKRLLGNTNYNVQQDTQYARDALYTAYRINYTAHYSRPDAGTIATNLSNDYPMFASFETSGNVIAHAVTIYQMNINAGSIQVMDPEEGSRISYANSSGIYQYIKNTNALTYVLSTYASKY